MVAVLVKIFGTENLQIAEDVVQDTLMKALETWQQNGLPENPAAWLYRVAKNKAIDIIRRNKFSVQYDFSDSERILLQSEYTLNVVMDTLWTAEQVNDDLLQMMFACCHPEIPEESQIALILKTLCGFSTAEIAKSFLSNDDTIAKRIYRAKEFFRLRKLRPEFPGVSEISGRINAVLKTIYLIFNEGYNATHADTLIRKDLLDQAIYLTGLLCGNQHTQLPEVYAAMALMHFHAARIDSRIGTDGDIILLSSQDRIKWNTSMISEGNEYLNKAATGDRLTSYHIEAAIAYEHCIALKFEDTNWERILFYYNLLENLHPSAIVSLNRLMVLFKLYGSAYVINEIASAPDTAGWEKNYLYHSLLGEIYAPSDKAAAIGHYMQAQTMTQSAAEKKLLSNKILALG
jgi:RNA polymerase sigma-70 factor (ECF subfamily)